MLPQEVQDLAILPPRRHGPVRGLVVADGLRPLAAGRGVDGDDDVFVAAAAAEVLGGVRGGRVCAGDGLVLRGPVVDVPVVLVEEQVVFCELGAGHAGEVRGGEGGEEEV